MINDDKTLYLDQTKYTKKSKKTKTLYLDQNDLPSKTIKIEQPTFGVRDITSDLQSEIDSTKSEVSKLVSSIKEIQREEKIAKRKRWVKAMKFRRRYF